MFVFSFCLGNSPAITQRVVEQGLILELCCVGNTGNMEDGNVLREGTSLRVECGKLANTETSDSTVSSKIATV
jgi:hypothetical protein